MLNRSLDQWVAEWMGWTQRRNQANNCTWWIKDDISMYLVPNSYKGQAIYSKEWCPSIDLNQFRVVLKHLQNSDEWHISEFFEKVNETLKMRWESDNPCGDTIFFNVTASDMLYLMLEDQEKLLKILKETVEYIAKERAEDPFNEESDNDE